MNGTHSIFIVGAIVAVGVNLPIRTARHVATTRIVLFSFWEYLAFAANSLVFLLIGLQVNVSQIVANIVPIGVAVLAVLVSRAVVVYGLT